MIVMLCVKTHMGGFMKTSVRIHTMVLSAILIAVGILIPMISPIKILIEPASFTLASHVAIIIAMFVSPSVAIAVALGTTLGFFLAGFPLPVVFRAFSHVVWAAAGGFYLKKYPNTFTSITKSIVFIIAIGLLHAVCEVLIVTPLYMGNMLSEANYAKGYMMSVFTLVGIGTVVHSTIDFMLSLAAWKVMVAMQSIVRISNVTQVKVLQKKPA